ncbi:hypothetical protein J8281_17805 [Aquimarina sp. U1-2]|uniref:hypothetical protein n=1 Tax=Aquimarina sp. U1-2 TaxID=2823141 RepID=UPI001AED0137|nr:hypothetical protein [Aquimarina sp. U1-2]MBP2834056.1 hypothetical protein [Aquimarina sp. U1-2]
MKQLILSAFVGITVLSCSNDDTSNTTIQNDNQKAFETYMTASTAFQSFDQLTLDAFNDVKNTSRSSKQNCVAIDALLAYQDAPILGFEAYDFYSALSLDFEKDECQSNEWQGRFEFYIAGLGTTKLRDSAVFKNVTYQNGYSFDGYRLSVQDEALSDEVTQVFDVTIDGILTAPDGTALRYKTQRNFEFENRFTPQETIGLIESSSLEDLQNLRLIETTSVENSVVKYDATCFNGLEFLRYPIAGIQNFTSNFGVNFSINYGDGSCDREVVLTGEDGNQLVFDL